MTIHRPFFLSLLVHVLGLAIMLLSSLPISITLAETPQIKTPVTDNAEVISPDFEEDISKKLIDIREQTGVQIAVLTIKSLNNEPIEDYSIQVATKWGGGSKQNSDGILFVIAVNDRRTRLEIGYGLEAVITDGMAKSMVDLLPEYFRKGDFGEGVMVVIEAIEAETSHLRPGEPREPPVHRQFATVSGGLALLTVVLFPIMLWVRKYGERTWLYVFGAAVFGLIYLFGLWYGLSWAVILVIHLALLTLGKKAFDDHRENLRKTQEASNNPVALEKKESEPKDQFLVQCIKLRDKTGGDDFVECPVCKTKVKAKNIVRHYNRVHGERKGKLSKLDFAEKDVYILLVIVPTISWVLVLFLASMETFFWIESPMDIWLVVPFLYGALTISIAAVANLLFLEKRRKTYSGTKHTGGRDEGKKRSNKSGKKNKSKKKKSTSRRSTQNHYSNNYSSTDYSSSDYSSTDWGGGGGGFGGGGASGSW